MKLVMKVNQEVLRDGGAGGSFINDNGIYDVTINFASIDKKPSKAVFINFNLDMNGNSQVLYGPCIIDSKGEETYGMDMVRKLGVLAGLEDGDQFETDTEVHKVGKDEEEVEFTVITDLSGLSCKLLIQLEYSKYEGKIFEKHLIRNVFSANGATAAEIVNETEYGKQLALTEEKLMPKTVYKDGLTEEDVEEWKAAKRGGDSKSESKPKSEKRTRRSKVFG